MVEGGRGCSKVRRSNHCHHGGDERHLIAGRANIHEATRPRPTSFTQDMRRTDQKNQEHNEASQTGNDTVDWTICRPPSISFNLRIMNKPTNHPSARPTNAQIDRPTDRLTDRPTDRPTNQPVNQSINQSINQSRNTRPLQHLISEEKCEEEDPDVRAVHVRVRHDHDAVIPQAGRVKLVTLSRRMIVDRSVGGRFENS